MGLRPTDRNEEALFVGRAPWPAADAHVGPAEGYRKPSNRQRLQRSAHNL